jgi:hypothetical protein
MNGTFSIEHLDKASELLPEGYGEAFSELYDFVRCQKADGSFYGTDTKCLSGIKKNKENIVSKDISIKQVAETIKKKVKKRTGKELTPEQIAAILAKDTTPV